MYKLANILLAINEILLKQTEEQKKRTYIMIAILAVFGVVGIMDAFAKNSFVGDKTYKKVWVFFSFLIVFIFIVLWLFVF